MGFETQIELKKKTSNFEKSLVGVSLARLLFPDSFFFVLCISSLYWEIPLFRLGIMSGNKDETLRQFCDVTGADEARSRFFLESSNWQLEVKLPKHIFHYEWMLKA